MIRSLKLEWLKIRNYRVFWILTIMYLLALVVIASGGMFLLEWLRDQGADFNGINPTILPIYDFPDIWQNTTYLATFTKVLLAFIVIISVNNDVTYRTLRQNIIDGISKKEFVLSKLIFIVAMAALSVGLLFTLGFINGSIYSSVWGVEFIFDEMEFLLVFFYEVIIYCTLAFLLSLIIKKAGFVIVALFLYTLMFEPIATVVMINRPYFQDTIIPDIAHFFPIKALNNLITVPYQRYVFMEIEDNVSIKALLIATAWFGFYLSSIFYILKKRDLN